MNTLLLIKKSITFFTLTFTLSIIPKQVMAVPDISNYAHQADTDVGTSLFQSLSLSEKSIFSTIVCKKEEPPNKGKPEDTSEGGGGR